MLPGETVGSGAPGPEQNENIHGPKIMHSNAGYYIGYTIWDSKYGLEDNYSRESGYYRTYSEAEAALNSGDYWR